MEKVKKTEKREKDQLVRLNKFLADAGAASRRKSDELIKKGAVKVNGKRVTELGTKIHPGDLVTLNGDPVTYLKHFIYILLNKPKDYITTTKDEKGRKTVMDIVRKRDRIFPVGRLDRNTTGALLLTNDGDLAFRLTHPKFEIQRVYNVTVDKKLDIKDINAIARGVDLDGEKTSPCEVFIDPENYMKATIGLTEGKNREVRRLFENFGYEVRKLDRKYFAGISTSSLQRGQYRHLTKREVIGLRKMVGLR